MTLDPTKRNGLKLADAEFLASIDEYGWVVTTVFTPVEEEGNDFAYSTGLYLRFGQPEIVMFGLALDWMHKIINRVGDQMKRGVHFVPDKDYPDILDRYPCQFKAVDRSHYAEHLGWSRWFYEGDEYPTLQCFWPDKNGFFPWQSECSVGIRKLQTPLFLPYTNGKERIQ